MVKVKTTHFCQICGAEFPKWSGQCSACGEWNTLVEEILKSKSSRYKGFAIGESEVTVMANLNLAEESRLTSGLLELDRVLGGGLVAGSVVLIGGNPGIGKSTLLIQTACYLSNDLNVLYVSGEESLQQITQRARRLELPEKNLLLLTETNVERILELAEKKKPHILIVDSIQTVHTDILQSAPGAVSQVRESAAQLVKFAKQTNTILFLVGHVTKEGTLAGPRVLEHMVDTVLYFESEQDNRYRIIRAIKNRFGAVNELGIFAMTEKGLKEVNNPSAIFLSRYKNSMPGSIILATKEGTRPLLVEVQGLVDQSHMANPRRVCVGLDPQRLAILLAVLHRHAGIKTYDQDVFINVVGGVKVSETAIDLAILLAVLSSFRNKPLPQELMVFGEIGLAGEIRPIAGGQERLREGQKQGFKYAIIPAANKPKNKLEDLEILPVNTVMDVIERFKELSGSVVQCSPL